MGKNSSMSTCSTTFIGRVGRPFATKYLEGLVSAYLTACCLLTLL